MPRFRQLRINGLTLCPRNLNPLFKTFLTSDETKIFTGIQTTLRCTKSSTTARPKSSDLPGSPIQAAATSEISFFCSAPIACLADSQISTIATMSGFESDSLLTLEADEPTEAKSIPAKCFNASEKRANIVLNSKSAKISLTSLMFGFGAKA